MRRFLLSLFFLADIIINSYCKTLPKKRFGFTPEALGRAAMIQFMNYAYAKMGGITCVTFVSDYYLGYMVGSLSACSFEVRFCKSYKYQIHYEGGNMTESVKKSANAGYNQRCGAYVVLLHDHRHIIQFLHRGDALFLVWYEGNDKNFEADRIWEKIPNVILFHSKPKRRESGVLFTIRELKWPIPLTSTEPRLRVIEFWDHNNSDQDNRQIWYYDKTIDMKNTTVRIVVVEHPPGVIKYTDSNGNVNYAGIEIQIVKSLAEIMKFSYELYDADPRTKWGGQVPSNVSRGAWGREFYGAVSRLIYGEADMGIGQFFVLKNYLSHIDMSIPLEVACTSFLTPNPLEKPRYFALILPFDFELWVLVITTSFVIGPLILYLFSAHPFHRTEYAVFRTRNQVVLTSFRLMTQVAFDIWPKFWPIRLYVGWYWIFWFCMTSAYRAAMVSFLSISLYESPIDTVQELADSNLQIGGWGEELQRIFFQHLQINSDQEKNNILENRYELLTDIDDGISRVAEGNFALYENIRFLKFIRMTRNLSNVGSPTMRVMKQCVVPVHIGFAYQKNSAITLTVNRYIRLFQESGLTKRWAQRLVLLTREHRRNNPEDQHSEEDGTSESGDNIGNNKSRKQRVLRIQDLQGVVYLLFLGLGLSLLTFFGEILHSRSEWRTRELQVDFLQRMINKSKGLRIKRKDYLVDVRVRKRKKVKRPKKHPLFPYVE